MKYSQFLVTVLNIKASMSHLLDHQAETNIQYMEAYKILRYVKMCIETV